MPASLKHSVITCLWTADDDDDAKKLRVAGNAVANDNKHHDEVFSKFSVVRLMSEPNRPHNWNSKICINPLAYVIVDGNCGEWYISLYIGTDNSSECFDCGLAKYANYVTSFAISHKLTFVL